MEEKNEEMEKIQTIQKEIFHIVTNNETNESVIVAGNYALLKCASIEEAMKRIDERDYELIINMMTLVIKKLNEIEKNEKENEN